MADKSGKKSAKNENDEVIRIPLGRYLSIARANPWVLTSIVLGILLICALGYILFYSFGNSGDIADAQEIGNKLVAYLNSYEKGDVVLVSVEREGMLYRITFEFEGKEIGLYSSLDGKYIISELAPLPNLNA